MLPATVANSTPLPFGHPPCETGGNTRGVSLTARPHPFSAERLALELPEGASLADMVAAAGLREGVPAHVWVEGVYIPRERWRRAYPRAGALVVVRAVPTGGEGGGKNVLRIVAMIAVTVVAAWAGGAAAAGGGFWVGNTAVAVSPLGGALITTAVGMAGSLLVNALIPPPAPKLDTSGSLSMDRGYAITGTRNRLLPFGTVPRVFGRHRLYPPMAALPYTESSGGDQYYRMMFCVGYGPLEISDMKIGETLLTEYESVETEIRQGYANDTPLTLYTNDIYEEAMSVALEQPEADWKSLSWHRGDWAAGTYYINETVRYDGRYYLAKVQTANSPTVAADWLLLPIYFNTPYVDSYHNTTTGDWTVRTTQVGAEGISLEFTASGLAYLRRLGRKGQVYIGLEIEYSPTGQSAWTKPALAVSGDGTAGGAGEAQIRGAEGDVKRLGVRWGVAAGQYDVRVRRVYSYAGLDDKDQWNLDYLLDNLYWSAIRSEQSIDPVQMAGLCKIALRIKATDQLSGVLDQFSCVAQALLPTWDGAAWTAETATASPAWAFAEVLTGAANKRALAKSRLDASALKSWADWCAANGIEYNAVLDAKSTVWQLLRDIAAVGFAAPSQVDGRYCVVRDVAQAAPVQHFTPRNSWGFSGSKTFVDLPHALKVRYLNPDEGWQQDEVTVYDDGYSSANATKFETLELFGVSSAAQAWKAGRYHLAVARLRPETYELWADVEHLVCTRGDLVRVSHDVAMWGAGWGRIKSVTLDAGSAIAVDLDESVIMEAGKAYRLRVRCADGTSVLATVTTVPGETTAISFAAPVAGIAVGDLAMFGESEKETVELLVKSIEPGADLSARLVLVDAAPGVHQAWTGAIPAFDSQITFPVDRTQIPAPVPRIDAIVSDESVLVRTVTGLQSRIVVSYSFPAGSTILADKVQAQWRLSGLSQAWSSLSDVTASRAGSIAIPDVIDGQRYDVRLRSVSAWGVPSDWAETSHTVEGKSNPPADVSGLALQFSGGRAIVTWDAHPDLDVQVGGAILIRHSRKTSGATWADGADIGGQIAGTATSANLPAISGTYMARAIDGGERLSTGTALVATDAPNLINYNVVQEISEHPAFSGVKTDVTAASGTLKLTETSGKAALEGVYEFAGSVDLGGAFLCRVVGVITAGGYEIGDTIDARLDPIDSWSAFDGSTVDDVSAQIEIRTTQDDPGGSPVWSAWKTLLTGTEIKLRALQARCRLKTGNQNHNVAVTELGVIVDMPDRTASARNVAVPAAGLAVTFTPAFKAIPAIGVTINNMQQGDYWQLTLQSAGGFTVQIFNGGAGVARNIDWQVTGYGAA